MKVKKNELVFLIALLGVLSAVLVYVWVYRPLQEKTETLEADNATQSVYVAQLESWASQVDQFKEDTTRMVNEINETFSRFPADIKSQDAIMYAVELEGADVDTYISSIGLTDPELVYESAPSSVKLSDESDGSEKTYRLYRKQVTYTQEFDYNGMKQYVNAIVNDKDRRSIDSLNMAYDSSSGILVGSTVLNLFTMEGADKEYREETIPSMPMGTTNIFGTLDKNESVVATEQTTDQTTEE